MRARKFVRHLVLTFAALSASSIAAAESGHQPKLMVADAVSMNHFGSTAVPQSLRSPNFNPRMEFSPQVELGRIGPVRANVPARREDRMISVPAASVSQRSSADSLLLALLGLTLIAYQLFRKHRLLRPHPFSF